jgi:hypothetical protein
MALSKPGSQQHRIALALLCHSHPRRGHTSTFRDQH